MPTARANIKINKESFFPNFNHWEDGRVGSVAETAVSVKLRRVIGCSRPIRLNPPSVITGGKLDVLAQEF
jgi:hypothetical protein